jgi:hypothetical protein
MMARGKITAGAVVGAAAVAGAVLLWPSADATAKPPTSDQIKASAHAALDHSLAEGRTARQVIVGKGYSPSDELCQAVWDRKDKAEQRALLYAEWMHGCADAPAP